MQRRKKQLLPPDGNSHSSYALASLLLLYRRRRIIDSSWLLVNGWEVLRPVCSSHLASHHLSIVQESLPQESKASPTVHDSFERLQLVHFALSGSLAPWQTERRVDSILVALDPNDKAPEFWNATADRLLHPGTQLLMLTLTHHLYKGLEEGVHSLHLW